MSVTSFEPLDLSTLRVEVIEIQRGEVTSPES